MASNLLATASNLLAMASNLLMIASYLQAMAFNPINSYFDLLFSLVFYFCVKPKTNAGSEYSKGWHRQCSFSIGRPRTGPNPSVK